MCQLASMLAVKCTKYMVHVKDNWLGRNCLEYSASTEILDVQFTSAKIFALIGSPTGSNRYSM